MRRVAAVLAGLLLAVPVGLVQADPASATTGTLTVITIGRDGRSVSATVQVDSLTLGGVDTRWVTSGRATSLPRGTYDVLTDIFNSRDGTDTLGAARVTVSGAARVVLDARRGQAVRAGLSPAAPAGYRQHFFMSICSKVTLGSVDAYTLGSVLYLIPSSLSSVETAFHSLWEPADPESHGPRFLATTIDRAGVPGGGTRTYRQSSLAAVRVSVRRGPMSGGPVVTLSSSAPDLCVGRLAQLSSNADLPSFFVAHVPSGPWEASVQGQEVAYGRPRTYLAGHTYALDINRSAWGPSGQLPYVRSAGRVGRLYANTVEMFADPVLDSGAGATTTYRLTRAGRTILSGTSSSVSGSTVFSSPGWYTFTAVATRRPRQKLPVNVLSTVSSLVLHFHADPTRSEQVKGYLMRFLPAGLDAVDNADPGSSTTVNLVLRRVRPYDQDIAQPADAPSRIRVWASPDGGRSWQALGVRKSGTIFTATVHNARSGFVSLRATVIDTSGSVTTTTVYRAYGLG